MSVDVDSPRLLSRPRLAVCFEGGESISQSRRCFWLLWTFIGVVSLLDAWLVLVNQSEMLFVERNICCYLLIKLDPHGLSYFLPAKAAGTLAVLSILRAIYLRLRGYGIVITTGVATYQFLLLIYFLF
jgi:hypothetical protein